MTTDRIDRPNQTGRPVGPSPVRPGTIQQHPMPATGGATFREILAERLQVDGVKFSAHAQARLAARNIDLGREDLDRITGAVNRAAAKGSRESLILMDDKAFVVSIRNRTVITAVDGDSLKENVFTNIDSAVIV
ncbi:MAG: TIGR02530 family flagellar biosynthesis protein [Clostridia bacterium]|nr:TIGR02530 family flagellar biosynthesis protein [Clostridia bacterium]